MWIKICGLTSEEAVGAALAASVDAIGFVLTASVRQVTPGQARALAVPARGRASCIAVMRQPSQALLDEVLAVFRPDALQTDAADFASLSVPTELARLPVVRAGASLPAPLPARLLFEGADSGSGVATDWTQAAALASRTQLVLAGGLSAANVADAIEQVAPFGVDVSSGVEFRPGMKSAAQIAQFVAAARGAFARAASRGDARAGSRS